MEGKNPSVAAILNFLIPGLGFVYIGTMFFVAGGLVAILFSLIESGLFLVYEVSPGLWILSLGSALAWAILGYGAAESVNGKLTVLPSQPPQLVAPQSVPLVQSSGKAYCIFCGMENPHEASFCRKCGKGIAK